MQGERSWLCQLLSEASYRQGRNHIRKMVWKAFGGALRERGGIVQWGAFKEIQRIQGFDGHDIILATEKAQVMAFVPQVVSLGSEGKLLWL